MRLRFERISRSIEIEDDGRALSPLPSVLRHWPFVEHTEPAADKPVITVRAEDTGYRLCAPWLQRPPRYSNPVNMACGLGVNLNRAMLEEQTGYLCLHGAGLVIGGRLVVLPNYYHAGKSALTVSLAAAGARVFSDDILPLLPDGTGMALGISPRLRLPLPDGLGKRSLRFIDSRRGAVNSQYLYVELDTQEQAPFGETAPFGGFVLLNRRKTGPAELSPASDGAVLKQVVLRNFARQVSAEKSLDRLHGLVAASSCCTLVYSNGDEAADLLMRHFSDVSVATEHGRDAGAPAEADPAEPAQLSVGGPHPWRKAGISERLAGGDLFLVDGDGEAIYHLNPIGAGLWRLMDGSCSPDEVADLLSRAFPDVECTVIERDVATITADLLARGLLCKGRD